MKRRTARAPMKSMIGRNDRALFTAEDRAHFESIQQRPADLPAGWLTRFEMRWVVDKMTQGYNQLAMVALAGASKRVREKYPHLWNEATGAADPMMVVRVMVAAFTMFDNIPEGLTTLDAAEAARDRVLGRTDDVLGQTDLYFLDPAPGAYAIRTIEDDNATIIDLPELIADVKARVTELREKGTITIDEMFRDRLDEGGRKHAYGFIRTLRASGDLPPLKATKGEVRVLNRAEYEKLSRGKFACASLACYAENCAEPVTWADLVADGSVEDGRVAVLVRHEEGLVSRQMRAIAFYDAPSEIEMLTHRLTHRDDDGGFEVQQ